MRSSLLLCGLSLIWLWLGSARPPEQQDEMANQVIQQVLSKGPTIRDFKADFSYTMAIPGSRPIVYHGSVFWSHGSYRIDLAQREIIVDGTTQWVFLPGQNRVHRSGYERGHSPDLIQTLYLFLISRAHRRYLGVEYERKALCDKIELNYLDNFFGFQKAYVWVNRKASFVQRMVLIDRYEKTTEYYFDNIKFNQNLPAALFHFDEVAYPGLEVIEGRE